MKFIIVFVTAFLLGYGDQKIDIVISNPKIINTTDGSMYTPCGAGGSTYAIR